jgi:indolepyruvate ferredoxin oxidoreductase, alpha subunit
VLNVTHPLVPDQIVDFARGKKAVLIVEEGSPEYIELSWARSSARPTSRRASTARTCCRRPGEYTAAVVGGGLAKFLDAYGIEPGGLAQWLDAVDANRKALDTLEAQPLPPRPPTFCTGCPERPVFSAMKLVREEMGPVHVSVDIGCHALATFPPFSQGHSIIGYGLSLAAASAVSGTQEKRPFTVMGDGGFWHNGLLTGVAGSVFNKDDSVLVVMNNGYSSATGAQDLPSSRPKDQGRGKGLDMEKALRSMGVSWIRRVDNYRVAKPRQGAARGAHDEGKGAEGHPCRRRMPTRPPAPHPAASWPRPWRRATGWCGHASGWTRTPARATTAASGCRAAPRSPSSPIPTRSAAIPWRM